MAPHSSPPATSSRSTNACEQCRRRKVKCSGDRPCRTCSKQNLECTFGSGRRRYSEAHVQRLLATIESYEEQLKAKDASLNAVNAGAATPAPQTGNNETNYPAAPVHGVEVLSASPAKSLGTERASGPAFESQVRSLFHSHTERDLNQSSPRISDRQGTSNLENDLPEKPPALEWCSTVDLVETPASFALPSEADSHRLLGLFLTDMSVTQHFLDPRTFLDSLTLLYESALSRERQMSTMWFTQYLLVMAMGKLLDNDTALASEPPGAAYFAEAMRRLPPIHQFGRRGIIAVEVLCLAGLYLQWCDRKRDAYLYVGNAVRLAIALGCSLPYSEQHGLPSEKTHRIRVWWTAYMLDRRISAALGLPAAADHRQLSFDLPRPAQGFQSPAPLNIKVRIAHATGEIMTSLYGNEALTEHELVRKIQSILASLYETGRSIPRRFTLDFSRDTMTVTRTGASLYLMLYQAIILCIRPIILQKVKDKVCSSSSAASISITAQLCQSCKEAASKSIRILTALQKQNMIARFGFFDLDTTFSGAFVLIMMGFVESDGSQGGPPPELQQAIDILDFLAGEGNKTARQRLSDVQDLSAQVWPARQTPGNEARARPHQPAARPRLFTGDMDEGWPSLPRNTREREPYGSQMTQQSWQPGQILTWDDGQGEDAAFPMGDEMPPTFGGFDLSADIGLELGTEAAGIYSSFNDPTLQLTGVDQFDWAEMEKMFASRPM